MQWVRTSLFIALALAVIGLAGAATAVFVKPELMPPGPFHPRALYYRFLGYPTNPWVKVDPAKSYTLRVWSTRWPLFRDGYGYDDLIDEAEAEFRMVHPNVEIEYVLLGLDEIAGAIREAVANTTQPDVCIAPFDPSLVESGLMVAVDAFMRGPAAGDTPPEAFEPRALQALTVEGRTWAWPAWISVQSWAGNAQLLREAGVDVEDVMTHGWSYDDVLTMVRSLAVRQRQARVEESDRAYALVFDAGSTAAVDVLMWASGIGLVLNRDASLAWRGASMAQVLSFLEMARDEGAFPEPIPEMGESILELFWTGRAAVIGPVGPGFACHIRERQERIASGKLRTVARGVEPVLLPVPHRPGGTANPCTSVTSAMVFMHPGRGGEDSARLAVEFARVLARKEALWLAREMCVVPAHLRDRALVLGMIGPDGASERFLISQAASGIVQRHGSASLVAREAEIRRNVIAPAIVEFWKGTLRADELDAYIAGNLRDGSPAGAKRN